MPASAAGIIVSRGQLLHYSVCCHMRYNYTDENYHRGICTFRAFIIAVLSQLSPRPLSGPISLKSFSLIRLQDQILPKQFPVGQPLCASSVSMLMYVQIDDPGDLKKLGLGRDPEAQAITLVQLSSTDSKHCSSNKTNHNPQGYDCDLRLVLVLLEHDSSFLIDHAHVVEAKTWLQEMLGIFPANYVRILSYSPL